MNGAFRPASLKRLRGFAESLMTDTYRISRYTGETTVDPDTGVGTPVMRPVYEGKGKLQTSGGEASDRVSATGASSNVGGNVAEWALYLHLPMSATGIRGKDMAECTASHDPELVGRRYRLVNMQSEKTHATARRWNVREIPREE
ncbi:DUF6093 family protein [Bifidobacterium scardovii]|uniref:Phage associated protein n=1 Tax=Bifidobacterium scardovii TaxID=158787 RepID=A0A087DGN3_9BIFI|nr:DUF6093 family protein [Bifidobacterium scardovii]DAE55475.1 MAG TPA: head closure knob [Caudoviricetes sp.]KFI94683.1 phage associated protein [Bifidobacterium scardovii]MDK6349821.1 DUF6093 family protein [Bifidobacterium scardovii]MDU8982525.1 DUF6093 family protein [Bifidobacterium scardovii]BAQ32087.1 hypothetical protein BBSC_2007 [Bifidobacterium scardovii JCM 12489 = DSM 13734]